MAKLTQESHPESICPVCGKLFIPNEDTCFIVKGGFTCSWKCFLDRVKQREKEIKENQKEKKK